MKLRNLIITIILTLAILTLIYDSFFADKERTVYVIDYEVVE